MKAVRVVPVVPPPPAPSELKRFRSRPPDMFNSNRTYEDNEAAQELVFDAWDCRSPEKRFHLCQQALKAFPFSVDAYNCVGDIFLHLWKDLVKAEQAYTYSLECGRLLWPELQSQDEILWGMIDNRPYLRTYHGLGVVLYTQGKIKEAVQHFRYLLRVNTSDNQGARLLLFQALIDLGEYREAEAVAEKHSDGRKTIECFFAYGYVIIDFLRYKLGATTDEKQPQETLVNALKINNIVPLLLLGDIPLPLLPDSVSSGSIDEATSYVHSARSSWNRTAGILDWLKELRSRGGPKPKDDGTTLFQLMAKGPVVVQLLKSPQQHDGSHAEVTTDVATIPGRGLPEFHLPPGMKRHDPSKMVCYSTNHFKSGGSFDDAKWINFSYDAVEQVYFWAMLEKSKVFQAGEEWYCGFCNSEPANLTCSRCKVEHYCSKECQKKQWKAGKYLVSHKVMCDKFIKT
jgi:tetratricopeptide (TPR) repeat protein